MPAAALIFAPTAGALGILSKKAKAKRAQAAANKWSTQFPLLDDYASMQANIEKANLQLKTLNGQRPKSGGVLKKWKAETAELSKWIGVMKGHLKDLKVGLDMASTNVQPAPAPASIALAPLPVEQAPTTVGQEAATTEGGVTTGDVAQNVANGQNLATTTKKTTNWLLIGGIAVGAIVLYRLLKK